MSYSRNLRGIYWNSINTPSSKPKAFFSICEVSTLFIDLHVNVPYNDRSHSIVLRWVLALGVMLKEISFVFP